MSFWQIAILICATLLSLAGMVLLGSLEKCISCNRLGIRWLMRMPRHCGLAVPHHKRCWEKKLVQMDRLDKMMDESMERRIKREAEKIRAEMGLKAKAKANE